MKFATAASMGVVTAAAGGGAYLGSQYSPDGIDSDERFGRAATVAAGTGLVGAGGVLAARSGVFKAGAKSFGSGIRRGIATRSGMMMAGGAAIGAGIGAYASDNTGRGAMIGAGAGAAAGGAARAAMRIRQIAKLPHTSPGRFAKGAMKAGVGGAAVLGTLAVAAGAHALMSSPQESSYSSTGEDGSTRYSDAPIKRRMEAMNATGDVVLGLHHKRRG